MAKASQVNRFEDATTQTEIENIYNVLNKIAFGDTAGQRCENVDGYIVSLTIAASATDASATHELKRSPKNWIQCWSNTTGVVYENSSGVSANTDSAAWFRATAIGDYRLILI